MRGLVCILACAVGLLGCRRLPGEDRTVEQGAATASALSVLSTAAEVADQLAARPPTACRPLRGESVDQVDTTLVFVRKSPEEHETIVERMTWMRDAAGNVSALRELEFQLPDGRMTSRTFETRIIDGVPYRAVDGRFADASRVPDVFEETEADAHRLVDDLLSLVRIEDGELVGAGFGDGICPGPVTPRLGTPDEANVDWTTSGRGGWLVFRDGPAETRVTFREVWGSAQGTVVAPDELWDVDADRTYIELRRFLEDGIEAGWLDVTSEGSGEGSGQSP